MTDEPVGTLEDYRADKAAGKWRFKSYEAIDIEPAPPGHIMFDDGVREPVGGERDGR